MKKRLTVKRIALLAVMCACALCVFTVENLLPAIIVPGAKLGLSNIFTLLAVVLLGGAEGVILVVIKSTLGCLIIGNMGALIYSLGAGLVSVAFSIVMLSIKKEVFTLTAISVGGAVIHNAVQTLVFCLVTGSVYALSLLPYLVLIGAIGGLSVGIIVTLVIKKVPETLWKKLECA